MEIINLSEEDKEIIKVITEAFTQKPQITIFKEKPELVEKTIRDLKNLHKKTNATQTYGIKQDGKIVTLIHLVKPGARINIFKLIKFGFTTLKTMGFKGLKEFWRLEREKPKYKQPYLELMFFATLPSYQKKGLGKQMLDFLYDYTKKNNYKGVIAVTNAEKPAFKIYMNEGWIIDKTFYVYNDKICWIRKEL